MNIGNLGGFAAGLAQGYNTERRFQADQEEAAANRNMRERGMRIQEQDASARQADRDREDSIRKELAALQQKHFAERDEPDTLMEQGNLGGQSKAVVVGTKKVKPDPMDPAVNAAYFRDFSAILAKQGKLTPEQAQKTAEYIENARRTEQGKILEGVLAGDKDALAALAKQQGKDPSKAKLDYRAQQGVMRVDWGDGTDLDMRKAFVMQAHGDQARRAVGLTNDEQENALQNLRREGLERGIKRSDTLLPLEVEDHKAGAALKRAQANRVNSAASASGGSGRGISKAVLDYVTKTAPVDPMGDGKQKSQLYIDFVGGQVARSGIKSDADIPAAHAAAVSKFNAMQSRADQYIAQNANRMKEIEAKLGVRGKHAVKQEIVRRMAGQTQQPAGGAAVDGGDEE